MREDHFTNTPEAAARYDRDTFADLYDEAPEWADEVTTHLCTDACREMCASFDRVLDAMKAGAA